MRDFAQLQEQVWAAAFAIELGSHTGGSGPGVTEIVRERAVVKANNAVRQLDGAEAAAKCGVGTHILV